MSLPGTSGKTTPLPPQTTLYVGNLSPSVTQAILLEKFSALGAVSSVKICRNRKTQHFTAWAFVQFRHMEDATRALESLNSILICGRPVRVMWAQDGSPAPEAPVGVLVRGLNPAIDSKALYDTFSMFGTIHGHNVFRDGTGYVQFDSEEVVKECIGKTAGWGLAGLSTIKLFTNVQVRNFGSRLNGSTLRDMFGHYGAIHEYRVVSNSGSSNGYAYVTFDKLESAAQAVVELNGKDFGGGVEISVVSAPQPAHPLEELDVKPRNKQKKLQKANPAEVHPRANLYIVVMDGLISNERLRNLFSPFGTIKSVRVLQGKGKRRAGFVCFGSKEEATRALNEMDGKIVDEAPLSVTYATIKKGPNAGQPVVRASEEPEKDRKLIPRDTSVTNGARDKPVGIFITGLNAAIRDADLRGIFASSGSIVECGVGADAAGNSKGFGFVQFEAEEAVESCLEKVKDWALVGSTLTVTKLYTNIHVYNFGYRLNFGSLRELFEPYGTILDYRIVKNTGKSRGFGYVTFEKLKSAAHAIGELNGKDLGEGFKLKVEAARRPSSDDEGFNLYIKIMQASATNESLHALFAPFGSIISAKVFTGPEGPGLRPGFVRFVSKEDATRAVSEMNGKVVGDGPLSVSFALAKNTKLTAALPTKPKNTAKSEKSVQAKPQTLSADQKRALADRLYLVVKQLNASMAGSITAKLLELTNLAQLMTQPAVLKTKFDETVVALLLNREQHLKQIESAPAGSAAA